MPNILFLITKSEIGGAQKYVKEQVDISHASFDVFLATNQSGWLTTATAEKLKGTLLDHRIEKRTSLGYLIKLVKYIRANNIKLVVANSANGGLYGRLAAKIAGIASIYVSHGWSSVYNGGRLMGVLNTVERYLSRLGSKVICVSEGDYNVARKLIRIPEEKLVLLKNNVFPVAGALTQVKKKQGDKLKLLSVARFLHPKRMDLLVAAMKGIDFAELYIVGGGNNFDTIQEYVRTNNLQHIFLLGEIQDFNGFDQYDAFILISDSEGLPMSALEAMSAGLPLILSNVGGCRELVVNKELLVENTVADIQRALTCLNEGYDAYSADIRVFFDANFNLALNQARFLDLYNTLVQ